RAGGRYRLAVALRLVGWLESARRRGRSVARPRSVFTASSVGPLGPELPRRLAGRSALASTARSRRRRVQYLQLLRSAPSAREVWAAERSVGRRGCPLDPRRLRGGVLLRTREPPVRAVPGARRIVRRPNDR